MCVRRVDLWGIILLASTVLAGPVRAQVVVGHVVEQGTHRPLTGAWVALQDPAGQQAIATLADREGRFVLKAPVGGEYRLVARLIGYADAQGDLFLLPEGKTVQRMLEVPVRAVSLEGIRVELGKRCYGRPTGGSQVATLWEEARKALEITEWAEEHGALRFHIIEHRRELEASSLRVIAMMEGARKALYDRSPYVSRPAEELATKGYIQPAADAPGQWDYWGPDGDVLLSDSFLDTHCFRIHPESNDRRVGLAFEPVAGRDLPEIEGVLWLDRSTAELEQLGFRYLNLPFEHGEWPQVGGRVDFERLATGVWIVRRWHIRMPLEAGRTGGYGGSRTELTLRTLSEEGAQVARVETLKGETLSESTGGTLYGVVIDYEDGEPLEDAVLELAPTGRQAVTNAEGVYRMSGLPGGTFEVRVTHPWFELLGAEPVVRDVTLEEGRARRLAIEPDLGRMALEFCGRSEEAPADPMVVLGTVRDATSGQPVAGALVAARTSIGEREAISGSAGTYALCLERSETEMAVVAIDVGSRARVRADVGGKRVPLPRGVLARADLEVKLAAMMAAVPSEKVAHLGHKWSNAIIGTVVDAADGIVITGATVVVRDEDGVPLYSTVTNEDGQFRFLHHSQNRHTYDISIEHAAYGQANRAIEFWPAEQLEIEVLLSKRPIAEKPIIVAERRRALLVEVGFYERLEQGAGIFIQREEIEERGPKLVTDLLEERPGIRVVATSPPHYDIRITPLGQPRTECQPSIWVDGLLVRAGGPLQNNSPGSAMPQERQPQLSHIMSPDLIEGMEVYSTLEGLALKYGGSHASCGAVLLWTRR